LDWRSFNIGLGESTTFLQPGASSIVWNRIGDASASVIYGSLRANGVVVLANSAGFYFGPSAFVQAAGLIATTAAINPSMIGAGPLEFSGPPTSIPIVNYGRLQSESGGSVFLIAKRIENHGSIEAPNGSVGLVAGQEVLISSRPDGLGLSARVRLPNGSVDNQGRIVADAGQILVAASTVNQEGHIEANAVRERNGTIELVASDSVHLGGQSLIEARGGRSSDGGRISIKSDHTYQDEPGSRILATGGSARGDGGQIEISAPTLLSLSSRLDAGAGPGYKAGTLLLDPTDITLGMTGSGGIGSGTVGVSDPPSNLLLDVNSAFGGFSQITLQASHNITLASGTLWDLAVATGHDEAGCHLTLQAGNDIQFQDGSRLLGGNNWSIDLFAGAGLTSGNAVVPGVGNLNLLGDATLEAGQGAVRVVAGDSVRVQTGAIRTVGGGSITVQAVQGDVDCGTNPDGFTFTKTGVGYKVSPTLGGISTAAGGDVTIEAGHNVRSFLPPSTGVGVTGDAGAGAFGSEPGNVSLTAGGNITGHYVVRNGQGTIQAAGDAGTFSQMLALSLVAGAWGVSAGDSIVLQEVRNPNGTYNNTQTRGSLRFHFDYDPMASVTLQAANQVFLSGVSLPRPSDGNSLALYPPRLAIDSGPGGVVLGNNLSLFPSPSGTLSIHTADGGDFRSSVAGQARSLVISDSDKTQWTQGGDFTEADRGANVMHINDPEPVSIDVAGSVVDINLFSPKAVTLSAGGSIRNTSVSAQNLRATDQTVIRAQGAITDRNYYSFVTLPAGTADPRFDLFAQAVDPLLRSYGSRFVYDPKTRSLGFGGRMTPSERDTLLNLEIANPDGTISSAAFVDPKVITQLFALSQDVPIVPILGYQIAGPGKLVVQAASLDLGVSQGIVSFGIANRAALVPYTPRGADIEITLANDLDMFSSTIISEYGGGIGIKAGGVVNVGSQERLGSSDLPRGIISLWGGNIDVVAQGNVEVNGSRIAAYDGGDINVMSLQGNVDAGAGGSGYVRVTKPYVDANGEITYANATIPGSGILATSYPVDIPGQASRIGNITVETPHGDILASQGGIVQVALGSASGRDASISLQAGSTDTDGTVHVGKIVATGSGVIGGNVTMKATGDIQGVVVAQSDLNIASRQNVSVTAIGQGTVNISASGTVSGTVVGIGAVNVSGQSISANMVSTAVSASGEVTAASTAPQAASPPPSGAGQSANQAAQAATQTDTAQTGNGDDAKRKKGKPQLTRYVGRVRVILP
jgi:filamentous hemagglutinin family protein